MPLPSAQSLLDNEDSALLQLVRDLKKRVAQLEARTNARTNFANASSLNVIVGTGDPFNIEDPFTGTAMLSPAYSHTSGNYHIIGMNAGTLQFGLSADDGKAYAAGGAAVIDVNGMTLEAQNNQSYFILWKTDDDSTTVGKIGAFYVGSDSGIEVVGGTKVGYAPVAHLMTADTDDSFLTGLEIRGDGDIQLDLRTATSGGAGAQRLRIMTNTSATNALNTVLVLQTNSSGTVANGLGTAMSFEIEDSAGNLDQAGYIAVDWTDKTSASEDAEFKLALMKAGTVTTALTVDPTTGVTAPFGVTISGGFLNIPTGSNLTIASGAVTATASRHLVDTEAAAATDDLDTISGGSEGDILIISTVNASRDVTAKDSTDNLRLNGDFLMDSTQDRLVLMKSGTAWFELSRSSNA